MSDQEIMSRHVGELERRLSPVFGSFALLDRHGITQEERSALGVMLAGVVELLVRHEVKVGDWFGQTVDAVLGQERFDRARVLAAWRAAVEEADPMVRAVVLVSRHLAGWLEKQSAASGAVLLERLPRLTVAFRDLGEADIEAVVSALASLENEDEARFMVDTIIAYDEAEASMISAVARLAEHAVAAGGMEQVRRLVALLPIEAAYESRDATRLIPAMTKLSTCCHEAGKGWWVAAMDLVLTIAETNVSSALVAASRLPGCLESLDPAAVPEYLAGFAALVRAMGTGVIGFGTRDLPRCFTRNGVRPTRRWLDMAVEVATGYGPTAGRWFLEQKTAAAREAFPAKR